MLADVLTEKLSYDPNTNESLRDWGFDRTIKCLVIPYLDGGIKGAGTREDYARERYESADYARLKSLETLTKRDRVTNVRHYRSGLVLWADEETDNRPTMFNVDGCSPVINPITGNANEYLSILSRAEVRD